MRKIKRLPVSQEDDAPLGLIEDTVLESFVDGNGALVVRPLRDFGDYACDGRHRDCPLFGTACDGKRKA
jgi:hypothetical protein